MIEKVLQTVEKYSLIQRGESIVVGLSGGPDSVCLLHVLHTLTSRLNIKLYAVHINHMLRGEESQLDEQYAINFCTSLGIPVYTIKVDIKALSKQEGISLEEAGREARYSQFDVYANKVGATKIAVAHNKNDQVETVLMRILRGTGIDGLKGMDYRRDRIIRPLLDIEREDIEIYCEGNFLKPRTDSSNLQTIYTRNKIRLDLIPYINMLFETDITDNIFKMSLLAKDDSDFVETASLELYDKCLVNKNKHEVQLDLLILENYHPAVKKRIVRKAIRDLKGDLKGVENVHIEDIITLGTKGRTGSEIHLPHKIHVSKSYNTLKLFIFVKENCPAVSYNESINIPGTTRLQANGALMEASIHNKSDLAGISSNAGQGLLEQIFDYDKLQAGINIRTRQNGDVFKPYKSNGTKKLKEYFIDNKIPRNVRESIPLVVIGNEIVWIVGYKISDKFKVTENTKCVLKLKYSDGHKVLQ
ncbi:MAG: tRNA lysidine(34) synthetase TilS [Clostridia bacterium]|nr:tRNA lysidine(34) synthetase TilS [Clostridia bacterium]